MALITYDDKVALNENASIPNINKVTASDMNEIKNAVNTNEASLSNLSEYTSNETVVGTWIDNKPIYRKIVYISALPNNTTGTYQTGITNMESLINMSGIYQGTVDEIRSTRPINFFDYTVQEQNITTFYAPGNNTIRIKTFYDWSALSGYVILEYTKTTD